MNPDIRKQISIVLLVVMPFICWLSVVWYHGILVKPDILQIWYLLKSTYQQPILMLAVIIGLTIAFFIVLLLNKLFDNEFEGFYFHRFLRGTALISQMKLKKITTEQKPQVTIAGIPLPTTIENQHLLIVGSTGSGKSVLMRELVYKAILRGDRCVIADPDGDMLSKFWREGDIILNPYDQRTVGWSFFNEIQHDYDFKRYALSIIPRGKTAEAEEWAGYARLLLRETARKLHSLGQSSVHDLFHWTTIATPEDLKDFLSGTDAESLFVGASKALASARFILSDKLPEHVNMPVGAFSLRQWLETKTSSNLYITWREDMAESLKPLISAWIDALCSSVLSLTEHESQRLWLVLDELASLEKLASLENALTKGRKKGLRVVAGLQSTSQLEEVYGEKGAQTIRACFRSLIILGGSKTDHKTCEDMSKSLGEHEVERESYSKSKSHNGNNDTTNNSIEKPKESVVMASQIASLPELTGYMALAGNRPIAKISFKIIQFVNRVASFK